MPVNQSPHLPLAALTITLLGGAAMGALAMALTMALTMPRNAKDLRAQMGYLRTWFGLGPAEPIATGHPAEAMSFI